MLGFRLKTIIETIFGNEGVSQYPANFSTRIQVQKCIYLLTHRKSAPKISLPYKWSFYLRGPYSSEMAHMIYHINEVPKELDEDEKSAKLQLIESPDEESIRIFQEFKKNIDQKQELIQLLSIDELYEACATLTYLGSKSNPIIESIIEKFLQLKPVIGTTLQESGLITLYNLLNQFGYV